MITMSSTLAFLGPIGWPEMVVLAVLGVLIFGKRLPEVGKSVGRGIVEFKKGLSGIQDDLDTTTPAGSTPRIENKASADSVSTSTRTQDQAAAAPGDVSSNPQHSA